MFDLGIAYGAQVGLKPRLVKVYNFQTSLGCYGPSKVKNKLIFDLLKKIQQVGKKVFFELYLPKISQ